MGETISLLLAFGLFCAGGLLGFAACAWLVIGAREPEPYVPMQLNAFPDEQRMPCSAAAAASREDA